MDIPFSEGSQVVYRGHGIGTIVGTESKGPSGDERLYLVVRFPSGMKAFMPVESAASQLRALCTREECLADLEILRRENVAPPSKVHREAKEEHDRTLKQGTRAEIAMLLRRMYAAKAPVSDANGLAIRNLEDIVLEEIALVLGVPRSELEEEMRKRYPIFATKKKA